MKLDFINGYRFNQYLSLGIVIRSYENDSYGMPLFLSLGITKMETKLSPCFTINAGVDD